MKLKAQKREILGKKVKVLRNEGKIPVSIYGPEIEPISAVIESKEFRKVFKDAGYSKLVDVELDTDKAVKALVKEIQFDPIKEKYLHVSLYQVNMKKPITADVPVHFEGVAPAVKNNIGLLITPISSLDVVCLPGDLPQYLEVNVGGLEGIGDSIQVSDLKLPENVEWDSSVTEDMVLARIAAPQKVVVETAEEGAEGEEGEEGAEGEEAKPEAGAAESAE